MNNHNQQRIPSRLTTLIAFSLALTGCLATKYHEQNFWDPQGYTDIEIEPGLYEIEAVGNAYTEPETVLGFWHRRASELCGVDNYTVELNKGQKDASTMIMVGTVPILVPFQFPKYHGFARCKN